jgi:hypothetical protein
MIAAKIARKIPMPPANRYCHKQHHRDCDAFCLGQERYRPIVRREKVRRQTVKLTGRAYAILSMHRDCVCSAFGVRWVEQSGSP